MCLILHATDYVCHRKFALLQRKPSIVDESNQDGAEQESFSEQERFVRTEITFTLRKYGGYRTSSLGGRSFSVVWQAGWLAGWQADQQKSYCLIKKI